MVERLVPTGEAAKALGVDIRRLQRWAAAGELTPDLVTPGGHMRWDVARLRAELRQRAARPPETGQDRRDG